MARHRGGALDDLYLEDGARARMAESENL